MIVSICFTWCSIGGYMSIQYTVCFTRIGDFTCGVSDCEELVGVLTGEDGVGFRWL